MSNFHQFLRKQLLFSNKHYLVYATSKNRFKKPKIIDNQMTRPYTCPINVIIIMIQNLTLFLPFASYEMPHQLKESQTWIVSLV